MDYLGNTCRFHSNNRCFLRILSRRNKKKQQEAQQLIGLPVKPGNKVKTIGGVCGIVVEVDPEENTFVLETGSETSGKCYMKFDKQAIYQTDAVVEKPAETEEKAEEPKAEEPFEESAPAEKQEEKAAEPAEEKPAEESKEDK